MIQLANIPIKYESIRKIPPGQSHCLRGILSLCIKFIDNSKNHDIIVMCAIVASAIIATTTNTGV